MPIAINIEHLKKTFRSKTRGLEEIRALDDVSLDIKEGEILGILGPNGAGKTTLLNILSTLLLPDSGKINILGIPWHPKNFYSLRSILNMSSGYPNYPWSLTVAENLRFYGKLYGLSNLELKEKIQSLVKLFELEPFINRRFEELSSGNKQKLSLAKAFLNDPKIIFLDEPTVGLDPDVSIKTRQVIRDVIKKRNVTVLFTTHNMIEAEQLCHRIAFIKEGQVIKVATPQELKAIHHKKDLEEVFVELAKGKDSGHSCEQILTVSGEKLAEVHIEQKHVWMRMGLWLKRCLAFSYRNYLFAVRNVFAFAELLFWPIVSLISIGLMGDFLSVGSNALAFILTGAITAGVLQVTQLDVAYSLLYEVWSKSMKHTLLTPIGATEHLFGAWLIGMVRGLAIFVVLGFAAGRLFAYHFPSFFVTGMFLLGLFVSAFLLGTLVNVLLLLFGQKAEITAWMLSYVFMLLCGIYYPIETLPPFFHGVAQWVPMTYFLEYFRESFGFPPLLSHGLMKGWGLNLLYFLLSLFLMRYAFFKARQKGTIVRLSE